MNIPKIFELRKSNQQARENVPNKLTIYAKDHHGCILTSVHPGKKSLVPFGAFSYLVGIPISKTFKVPPFREVFANYVICSCIDRTEEHEAHETMYMTSQNRNNQQSTVQGGMKFQKLGLLINPFFHFPTQKKHQHNCTSQLHAIAV